MIDGTVAPGFEPVRAAFAENFSRRGDTGAAVAVYVDGAEVVDLWGGDARPGTPWRRDTLACAFSTAKPVLATAIAILSDRGELDVDAPIARVWPEFAANGKAGVTTAHVLTHTAGLPSFAGYRDVVCFDDPRSFGDVARITSALADAAPLWEPGTRIGSHSISVGWLLGEIVRRVSGITIGAFVEREIAGPLGIDVWIGLPRDEQERAADMIADPAYDSDAVAQFLNPETPAGQALFLGPERRMGTALQTATNDPEYRTFENPAAGTFTTARGLARVYGMLARGGEIDGVRLLSEECVARFTAVAMEGDDVIFGVPARASLGFLRPTAALRMGPNDEAFGMPGQGGQSAFGDARSRLGFAYYPAVGVFGQGEDPRARALIDAAYAGLGASVA